VVEETRSGKRQEGTRGRDEEEMKELEKGGGKDIATIGNTIAPITYSGTAQW
jgi:hypothetical protein